MSPKAPIFNVTSPPPLVLPFTDKSALVLLSVVSKSINVLVLVSAIINSPFEFTRNAWLPAVSTENVSASLNLIAVSVSPVWTILSAISTSPVNVPVEPATVPPLMFPVTFPVNAPTNVVDVVTPVANIFPSGLTVIPEPTITSPELLILNLSVVLVVWIVSKLSLPLAIVILLIPDILFGFTTVIWVHFPPNCFTI